MPDADELIRRRLEEAAEPADPAGAFERVLERKIRREIYRRGAIAALVAAVVLGVAVGTYALSGVFGRGAHGPQPVSPAPGPMNGRIAFVAPSGDVRGIYAANQDGSEVRLLTDPSLDASDPAWSPDGSMIAFDGAAKGDTSIRDIYIMNADGSGVLQITQSDGTYLYPSWSPDGRIVYFAGDPEVGEQRSVFALPLAGGAMRFVAAPIACHPAGISVSPDGTRVAFRTACDAGPGAVHVAGADGSGEGGFPPTAGAVTGPSWSPDGGFLVYGTTSEIRMIRADGTGDRIVATVAGVDPSFSPDGSRILFGNVSGHGPTSISVMDLDGTHLANIGGLPQFASSPSWQPVPPGGVPSPVRPPAPTPTPAPSPSISVGSGPCDRSTVSADFDGDGLRDTVTIERSTCRPTPHQGPGFDWTIEVNWGAGAAGSWAMPECSTVCRAVAVVDLDGNGTGELILEVDQGASTSRYEVLEVWASEIGPQPATVVPPGTLDHPGGSPLVLPAGGSVTHQDFVTCRVQDGTHQVIATSYSLDQAQTEYRVHQLIFDVTSDRLLGNPPTFAVASFNDSTRPFDPSGGPLPVEGDACWPTG